MKTAIYIGNFSFPFGNAAGKRVYANGKALKEIGYDVLFIGMSKDIDAQSSLISTENTYDGFSFYNFPYPRVSLDWLNYRGAYKKLMRFFEDRQLIGTLDLIIFYGSPSLSLFNTKLTRFCMRNQIKVVTDCVDWLTAKTRNPIFNLIKWADNTYQKAYANKKTDGVIAISSYLSNYYKKAGLKTIIVPPLSLTYYESSGETYHSGHRKIITYAGLPFRKGQIISDLSTLKDRIDKTITILHGVKKNGGEFIFNIYGFTKDEYLCAIPSQCKYVDDLGDSINFHGFTKYDEVAKHILESDFTILIRDVNRATTSGFPTKVSESISCGTPVITTRTSDLENYIVEHETGYFLDFDIEAAIVQCSRIIDMDKNDVLKMKRNCASSNIFSWERYVYGMKGFLKTI